MVDSAASVVHRLNWLFDVMRSGTGRPYTAGEVAQAVCEALGLPDVLDRETAIAQVRAGRPSTMSVAELAAIAEFFGAQAAYFDNDDVEAVSAQLDLISSALRRGGIERMRLCRMGEVGAAQQRELGLVLLGCSRQPKQISDSPKQPHSGQVICEDPGRRPRTGEARAVAAMSYAELREFCRQLLYDLDLRPPLEPTTLCQRLGAARGRPIKLFPREMPIAAAAGALMVAADRDLITYQASTTLAQQAHVIHHEIVHLVRGHLTDRAALTCGSLLADEQLDEHGTRRSFYEEWHEWEAETGATILSEWSYWDTHGKEHGLKSPRALRLHAALDDPDWGH